MSMDTTCLLQLVLKCTSTSTTSTETLKLESLPQTVLDIKEHIQAVLSIPLCTQVIQHESTVLNDSDDLSMHRIRSGDTLYVTYEAKADCAEVESALTWLTTLQTLFDTHLPSIADETQSESEVMLLTAIQQGFLEDLRKGLFLPWDSTERQMNKVYFLSIGGLEVLLKVYSILLQQGWQNCLPHLKHLEVSVINALYNLASTFQHRHILIKHGCIELCMQSLLRAKVPRQDRIGDGDVFLLDVVASAMGTLCNMCETSEAHIKISSNHEVLEQFISVAHSPSFSCWCGQLAMNAFVCFAHNAEVHPYLAEPDVVTGVIDTCKAQSDHGSDPLEILLLQYFVQLFLAQLVLVSPKLLSPSLYSKVHTHMSTFLANASPSVVANQEYKSGCFWSVFLPFVKLPYVPTPNFISTTDCKEEISLSSLWLLSMETALFGLQCMLGPNTECLEGLLKEELNGYIICMPGHVPPQLREMATTLVATLGTHIQLQPPSLGVLARAKLAKMHFGLERMLQVYYVQQLFSS